MIFESRMPVLRSLVKNRFLQVSLFGLILAGAAAPLTQVAPSKAQEQKQGPADASHITLVVEKGFVIPSQLLTGVEGQQSDGIALIESLRLSERFITGAPLDVTFTISGNARFESGGADGLLAVALTENGVIKTPAIVAGPAPGESFIEVMVNSQTVIEKLRVATVETGWLNNIDKFIPSGDPALIARGDHYLVLDMNKVGDTTRAFTWSGKAPKIKAGILGGDTMNQGTLKASDQDVVAASGLCFRLLLTAGLVYWHWSSSNPWSSGGYGYLTEDNPPWAVYRADDLVEDRIDAVYNRYWGQTVLKVPNGCTVDWNQNGSWSACCHWTNHVAGLLPRWTTTGAEGFPRNTL